MNAKPNYRLLFLLILLVVAGCIKPDDEIHYLPAHYTGEVAVLFGQGDGKEREYTGSRRVYRIPECGILKTRFKRPYEVTYDIEKINSSVIFVYVDKSDRVTDTIPFLPLDFEFDNKKFSDFFSRNQNKVYVNHWTYGDFSVSDSTRSETYDDVEYYVVDSLKNLDRYRVMSFEMSDLRECE